MKNILMITGTDTQVGKTYVTCMLARALLARGLNIRVRKPVETGTGLLQRAAGECSDAELLSDAVDGRESAREICKHAFEPALAPALAAELAGEAIDVRAIVSELSEASAECDLLLVEGAGGLFVPLRDDYSFLNLARDLHASVLVVVASRLGCLNHALLTLDALAAHDVPVAGYVLNEIHPPGALAPVELDARRTNRSFLARLAARSGARELAMLSHQPKVSKEIDFSQFAPAVAALMRDFGFA